MVIPINLEVVKKCGANAAIMLCLLELHLSMRQKNDSEYVFACGNWWIYGSISYWRKHIDFMTDKQIENALNKLVAAGIIEVGSLGNSPYDHWYSIAEMNGERHLRNE